MIEITDDCLVLSVPDGDRRVTLRIPLDPSPSGPNAAPESGRPNRWSALAIIINRLLSEGPEGHEARLRAGHDLAWYDVSVWHPTPKEANDARVAWVEFEGSEALLTGELVMLDDSLGGHSMIFPKAHLLEIVEALRAVRTAPPPVPWLFRVDPYGFGGPGDGEEALVAELELRAAELDATVVLPGATNAAESSSRRRFLLGDLEAAGLFEPAAREARDMYLALWAMPTLLSYLRAAEALEAYGVSTDRQRTLPEASPPHPIRGPISLDWFRSGAPCPDGWTADDWLSVCEFWFLQSGPADDLSKPEELFVRLPQGTYRFDWRRDDGVHAALVSVQGA